MHIIKNIPIVLKREKNDGFVGGEKKKKRNFSFQEREGLNGEKTHQSYEHHEQQEKRKARGMNPPSGGHEGINRGTTVVFIRKKVVVPRQMLSGWSWKKVVQTITKKRTTCTSGKF